MASFEQRLLGADIERRDLGDRVDQHFIVEPGDRGPVDRKAERVAEPARFALHLRALDQRQRLGLLVVERGDVDLGAAVGGIGLGLADQPKAVGAQQHDVEPPVIKLLDPDHLADAADVVERRLVVVVEPVRLDHRDLAGAVDRVADHLAVARFEDVERQLRARKQDRAGQREDRDAERSAHVKSSAESRRRCALDHGSSRPCASSS